MLFTPKKDLTKIYPILLTALFLTFSAHAEKFTSEFNQQFVKINSGEFIMGTQQYDALVKEVKPKKHHKIKKELPAHKVSISKDFWLATTEVTQGMWYEEMGTKPGKEKRWLHKDWEQLPVTNVNWDAVQEFLLILNEQYDGYHFRLPTEAEWEYAARAGSKELRPFNFNKMKEYVWFRGSSNDKPRPVGTLKPNAWGLHDMQGNVWEWVNDSYDANYYSISPSVDPKGPTTSTRKVMRGGSYHCTPERARVSIRGSFIKHRSMPVLGFRIAADKVEQ